MISPTCTPIVFTGLSELPGSCGTGLIRAPRRVSRRFADHRLISSPLSTIFPASRRALSASRPMIACAVVVLPEPDSPTKASISPPEGEADVMHHLAPPARGTVADGQVFYREYGHFRPPLNCWLIRLVASTTAMTTTPGKVVSHRAVER